MPPQLSYLNLIENLWNTLAMKIRKKKISYKLELKPALWDEQLEISSEICDKPMPRRLQTIIEAKGLHT